VNCPSCHSANPDGARFCLNCGTGLAATRPVEGERKFVTVLFADVVGSTAIGEQLDPEQVMEVMDGSFAFLNAAVAKFGGTVARLMGDAILAIFGAPVAHEDDAERAVRAGLEIQAAAARYAETVELRYGIDFSMRVGINTGLVALAVVGDRNKTEYTAMGDTTNVAARLQGAAEPGSVLISADSYQLVKTAFEFKSRGPLEVKGKSTPVEAYEVLAPKARPGRSRGLEGITSPLVGRAVEFQVLRAKLDDLHRGRGAFVAVIGEAGLGKSRLIAELQTLATAGALPETAWFEGRALAYGQATAYLLWREILRGAIGAREEDLPEAAREKLRVTCEPLGVPEADRALIESVMAIESDSSAQATGSPAGEVLVERIAAAIGTLLEALAHQSPTVLVFDDLHWADVASLELLEKVSDLVERQALLVVAVLRPDKEAQIWSAVDRARTSLGSHFQQIALDPLSAEHAQELLGNLLRIEDLPASVRGLMLQKSDGNPFFLEEVIRALIDSGHIVRDGQHWRATRDIREVAIPDTLAGVLSARLDRLPGETKRVTQAAAVIGRLFARRVLGAVCTGAPPGERIDEIGPHLATLTREELVRERVRESELDYIFKHALTQEAAYESLLIRRRKQLHRRTGSALEALYPDRLDELAPLLGHHFWLGEDWPRAAEYSLQAGARAGRMYALPEAIEHLDRACKALERSGDSPPENLFDAIISWTWVAYKLQYYEEMLKRLARAEAIARELNDRARLADALVWTANVHILMGFPPRAMPLLAASQQLAAELGASHLALLPLYVATMSMVDQDPRAALKQLAQVIELAQVEANPEVEAHAVGLKAIAHARVGEFAAAQTAIDAAFGVAKKTRSALKHAEVWMATGIAYFDMGQVARGLEHTRRGTELALSVGGMACTCYGYYQTGLGSLRLHDTAAAQESFRESAKLLEAAGVGMEGIEIGVYAGMAITECAAGNSEALEKLENALANARALGDGYAAASMAQVLGERYLQAGELERAEAQLNAALGFYQGNGMWPYVAGSLQSLADLQDKLGRTADAAVSRGEAERLRQSLQEAAASVRQ
jgi:class 3 adenylate cyclase/tetratricopeptide (TPR) repeat protein